MWSRLSVDSFFPLFHSSSPLPLDIAYILFLSLLLSRDMGWEISVSYLTLLPTCCLAGNLCPVSLSPNNNIQYFLNVHTIPIFFTQFSPLGPSHPIHYPQIRVAILQSFRGIHLGFSTFNHQLTLAYIFLWFSLLF